MGAIWAALAAFNDTTGAPVTGDAANQIFCVTKDWGTTTAIAANSGVPTEIDATNAKGWYKIALAQGETNASTTNIVVNGQLLFTDPAGYSGQIAP